MPARKYPEFLNIPPTNIPPFQIRSNKMPPPKMPYGFGGYNKSHPILGGTHNLFDFVRMIFDQQAFIS